MDFVDMLKARLGSRFKTDGLSHQELLDVGSHYIAEAESGWDFNPGSRRAAWTSAPSI